MVAKAGELAKKSGEFICAECEDSLYIEKDEEIPTCQCGSDTFEERVKEPANPSTPKSKKNR